MDIIIPNTTYRYKLFGGVSFDNPSILFLTSSSQNFTYGLRPLEWITGTADDWGRWGRESMPRQLLLAPGPGTFFNTAWAVASGNMTLGSPAVDTLVGINIYQNSFGLVNGEVDSASMSLGSVNVLITAGNTIDWQLVCGANNTFNGGPGYTEQIQLSVGMSVINGTGTSPTAKMFQFEFQS